MRIRNFTRNDLYMITLIVLTSIIVMCLLTVWITTVIPIVSDYVKHHPNVIFATVYYLPPLESRLL